MAYNVKFFKGSLANYEALPAKDPNTFYYVNGTDLYLGTIKLSQASDLAAAIVRISENETDILSLQAQIDSLIGGDVGDNSSIKALIDGLREEFKPLIEANESAINAEITRATTVETDLQNAINTLGLSIEENEIDIEKKISELIARVSTNETDIDNNANEIVRVDETAEQNKTDIASLLAKVSTLIDTDVEKSVRTIANEELATQLLHENGAVDNFTTLKELATWLEQHPEDVAAMNVQIEANKTAHETNASAIADNKSRIDAMLDEALGLLAQSKSYTDEKVGETSSALESINEQLVELEEAVGDNTEAIADINDAATGILARAQAKIEALKETLGTAAYKSADEFEVAGAAENALAEAKEYVNGALSWGEIPEIVE